MHRCLRCLTVNHDRGFVLGDRRKHDSISIILLNHQNDQRALYVPDSPVHGNVHVQLKIVHGQSRSLSLRKCHFSNNESTSLDRAPCSSTPRSCSFLKQECHFRASTNGLPIFRL